MYILMAYFSTVLYTLYSVVVKCEHKLDTDSLPQVLNLMITLLGI